MLAYTKNLAAYTKLSSENQQVKLQCMQCMQKLKIKYVYNSPLMKALQDEEGELYTQIWVCL